MNWFLKNITAKDQRDQLARDHKLVSSVVLFRENKNKVEILLEKHVEWSDKKNEAYTLPGGHVDPGETDEQTAVRELKEETNIKISEDNLVYIGEKDREKNRDKRDKIFAAVLEKDQKIKAGSDADEVFWSTLKDMPPLEYHHDFFAFKAYKELFDEEVPCEGLLVVFEGIDGSGKTSLIDKIAAWLEEEDYDFIQTKWNSSELIKPVIDEAKEKTALTPKLYSLLHMSDMIERYESIILPALIRGKIVVCDRYTPTSYIRDTVRDIDTKVHDCIYKDLKEPDIIFYCDAPADVCYERTKNEKGFSHYAGGLDLALSSDRDENCRQYQKLMQNAYEKHIPKLKNVSKVNTNRSKSDIFNDVKNILSKKIKSFAKAIS